MNLVKHEPRTKPQEPRAYNGEHESELLERITEATWPRVPRGRDRVYRRPGLYPE